jgi:hypothetical protein
MMLYIIRISLYMRENFSPEQVRQMREAAEKPGAALHEGQETVAIIPEIPTSAETQPIPVVKQNRHAVALDLAGVRAHIAAMDSTATSVERAPGSKDARALDVSAIREELDRRDAGLQDGVLGKITRFFKRRRP